MTSRLWLATVLLGSLAGLASKGVTVGIMGGGGLIPVDLFGDILLGGVAGAIKSSGSLRLGERITTPGLGERITTPGAGGDLSFSGLLLPPWVAVGGVPSVTRGACSLSGGGGGGGGDDDGELGASELLLEDLARRRVLVTGLRDLVLLLGLAVSFLCSCKG